MPLKSIEPSVLCQECKPSPGWGYHINEENEWNWRNNVNALPPASNGWEHDGMCKNCDGKGVDKYGRVNAGAPTMLGCGAWCFGCLGTGVINLPGKDGYYSDWGEDQEYHGPKKACEECEGTGRDPMPWSELFADWHDRFGK